MFAFFKKLFGKADVNKDGKVNAQDAKAVADVNKDGKVDVQDIKETAKKVKSAVKKPAVKAKTARTKKTKPAA